MPLPTDRSVAYVTQAECASYKDLVMDAVLALGHAIQADTALLETEAGRLFATTYQRFVERVRAWYADESCWWGTTTDHGVELAREYNSFEAQYLETGSEDVPWTPGRRDGPSSSSAWPWLLGAVALVGAVAGGIYFWQRRQVTRAVGRRALGAVRRSGVDGPSLYQLERE
jgi:hypothetical protein